MSNSCLGYVLYVHVQLGTPGVTTNSATATNCDSLYDLRGIH